MSENVPFKHPKGINEMRALNTTDRVCVGPACHNDDVNGTRAPAGGHTANSSADPSYSHWCRPEPTKEFPFENAEKDRYVERRGGMQDDTDLPRASNGGVMGSQVGVRVPKDSPHFQKTGWGEYNDLNQWDKEQGHTYDGERDERNVDELERSTHMAHNDSPDSGYEHFHNSGRKSPHMGKLVDPLGGGHKAPDSGTKWKSDPGKDSGHGIPGAQKNVPGSVGPGGIVGP